MEFVKIKDFTKLIHEGQLVGYIQVDRTSEGNIKGYWVKFYSEILGFHYGEHRRTYKIAKIAAESSYKNMLEKIKSHPFYNIELDMYFATEERCNNYDNGNRVAEGRKREVLKRVKEG